MVFHIQRATCSVLLTSITRMSYPGHRIFAVNIKDYAYLVPFVESGSEVFLKTINPSCRAIGEYPSCKREACVMYLFETELHGVRRLCVGTESSR